MSQAAHLTKRFNFCFRQKKHEVHSKMTNIVGHFKHKTDCNNVFNVNNFNYLNNMGFLTIYKS